VAASPSNWRQEDAVTAADKPFRIDKKLVYEAYKAVKANAGAAGVDGQTIAQFDADLKGNLYKIWNRMSSGSYFPPPVRAVAIPKKDWRAAASGGANRSRSCGADGCQADDRAESGRHIPG
jgi:retron-type reverse transcriptase